MCTRLIMCGLLSGGNFLNSSASGTKPVGTPAASGTITAPASAATVTPTSAAPTVETPTVSAAKVDSETPMTAAAATETALSVVAQWEEEKVIQPVGQDYVEELRGPDG